jgi:hypothetical protein
MTKEEIVEMARRAGMMTRVLYLGRNLELLERFAKLVAEHEREACAKRLDAVGCDHCATNIRTRGQE